MVLKFKVIAFNLKAIAIFSSVLVQKMPILALRMAILVRYLRDSKIILQNGRKLGSVGKLYIK